MSSEIETATAVVNGVATVAFLLLLGATLFSMLRRVRDYWTAELPLPVLLKRGLVMFASLAIIGGEAVTLRVLNVVLAMGSLERLAFIVQADLILLGGMAYYAKVELLDLNDDHKT